MFLSVQMGGMDYTAVGGGEASGRRLLRLLGGGGEEADTGKKQRMVGEEDLGNKIQFLEHSFYLPFSFQRWLGSPPPRVTFLEEAQEHRFDVKAQGVRHQVGIGFF